MVFDRIENLHLYAPLHALLPRIVEFLAHTDLRSLALGRHDIAPGLYVNRDNAVGLGRQGRVMELHRKYIDVQIALDRPDVIGCKPAATCRQLHQAYDPSRNMEFFADPPDDWLTLPVGSFAIFLPTDAHAPLAMDGAIQKAIFKMAMAGGQTTG